MNRGVDKRSLALDDRDRERFVYDLFVMNDTTPVNNLWFKFRRDGAHLGKEVEPRDRLVTVHAWCLMRNHYHMLLSERTDGGMSEYLQRLNGGYARYFNERHERSGALFQGKTKRVLIENDRQFLYILSYIHLNPLDTHRQSKEWRLQSIANPRVALQWVTDYRWSSLKNYTGSPEWVQILEGSDIFAERKNHARELEHYLRTMQDQSLATFRLE